MRWFPRLRTAREVGVELVRGLRDGTFGLDVERWARLEAVLPEAAEARRQLVALQVEGTESVERMNRSITRDYVRSVSAALLALALIGCGMWMSVWFWSGLMSALGGAVGLVAGLCFARAWHDHHKLSVIARWVDAIQGYIDWPAPETEAALRQAVSDAEQTVNVNARPVAPVRSVGDALGRLPTGTLVDTP